MSFSSEVKNEIMQQPYKSLCCRHALLQGAIIGKGILFDGNRIECRVENDAVSEYLLALAADFDKEAATVTSKKGGRGKIISIVSPSLKRFITETESGNYERAFKCPGCMTAFYRGLYLTAGRLTDPKKQFLLEFSANIRTDVISALLSNVGVELRAIKRRDETVLYSKNSTVLEDFFSLTQLNSVLFEIVNIKIENEFKNNANRQRNIDTVNITKAVTAANQQLAVIKKLADKGLLSSLPPELEATARMRLLHPDLSLSQLSINSVPPVSKSGLSHRLERIMKLGEEILSKN